MSRKVLTVPAVVWPVVLAGSLLFLGACARPYDGGRDTAPPPGQMSGDPVGRYELVSVDGVTVPGEVQHGPVAVRIHSGWIVIDADGTCVSRSVFGPPDRDEKATREVSCTYERDGATLTMQWEGAGRTVGSVEGDTFTMDNHGMIFRYERAPSQAPLSGPRRHTGETRE